MKYLIQIYSNPESRAMWESFSPEQQAEGYAYYQGINDELASSGEFVASEALADISMAKRVTHTDGGTVASDGPFAETKELLAGFYLVDVEGEAARRRDRGPIPRGRVRPHRGPPGARHGGPRGRLSRRRP